MPTFKSDLVTKRDAAPKSISANTIDGDAVAGIALRTTAIYTIAGTEVANDIIELVDIPLGAVIIPQECSILAEDPGTALVIDIGDTANDDGVADGVVLSAGGLFNAVSNSAAIPADALTPRRHNSPTRLFATVKTATELTAGAKLVFIIAYRAIG